jgi:hypothetical protein
MNVETALTQQCGRYIVTEEVNEHVTRRRTLFPPDHYGDVSRTSTVRRTVLIIEKMYATPDKLIVFVIARARQLW